MSVEAIAIPFEVRRLAIKILLNVVAFAFAYKTVKVWVEISGSSDSGQRRQP